MKLVEIVQFLQRIFNFSVKFCKIQNFEILKFQSAITVPDFHFAAQIFPSQDRFWPVEYKSGGKNEIASEAGT